MKVLCLHGIGRQESLPDWKAHWERAINTGLTAAGPNEFDYLEYDAIFAPRLERFSRVEYASALAQLAYGRWSLRRERGLFAPGPNEQWYAGMVVVWVGDERLRSTLRELLENKIKEFKPQLIVAHSLGSLIAYDTIGQNTGLLDNRTLLTLGSQIGNPFVQGGVFGGYVQPLPKGQWFHLFNPYDPMFTAPLDTAAFRQAANFVQIDTLFGVEPAYWNAYLGSVDNHYAVNPNKPGEGYLDHSATRAIVYPRLAPAAAPVSRAMAAMPTAVPPPNRRTLIIGINQYPDAANRLEGCVNDAFRMSEVLQECGFEPEDIRVVLDERATADSLRERLHWLLDDVRDGDTRVLTYSGHGTRLPCYGPEGKVDRVATCLVPYDFNWTMETAITDEDLVGLYSTLPYKAHFLMILDCCHSGGIVRGGGRTRGLEPPDDIRHRMLRWNAAEQMWEPRQLPAINESLPAKVAGANRATMELGTGVSLRPHKKADYNKARKAFGHEGPYMPIVFQACGAEQKAEEYAHGVTPFGAFTHAVTTQLRLAKRVTFQDLLERTADRLKKSGYAQKPHLVGPTEMLKKIVPWGLAQPAEK